jgi:hypothetical protein
MKRPFVHSLFETRILLFWFLATYRVYRQYHIRQLPQSHMIDEVIKPGLINRRDACYVDAFMQLLFHVLPLRSLIVAWPNRDLIIAALHLIFFAMSQDRLIDAVSCRITVDCMWARRLWWQKLLRTGLARIRGAPRCFFGNAEDNNSTIVLFQTDHSTVYPFLLQTCFRSTFILLTPFRIRVIYLDRMAEFLPHGYLTWCWTTSSTTQFHSFISQVLLLRSWSPRMDKRSYGERL